MRGTRRDGSGNLSRDAGRHRAGARRGVFEPDRLPLRRAAAAALPRHRACQRHRRARHRVRQCRRSPISSARWRWPSSCSIPASARRSACSGRRPRRRSRWPRVGVVLTTGIFGAAAHLSDRLHLAGIAACSAPPSPRPTRRPCSSCCAPATSICATACARRWKSNPAPTTRSPSSSPSRWSRSSRVGADPGRRGADRRPRRRLRRRRWGSAPSVGIAGGFAIVRLVDRLQSRPAACCRSSC